MGVCKVEDCAGQYHPSKCNRTNMFQILVDHLKLEKALLIKESYSNSMHPYTNTIVALNQQYLSSTHPHSNPQRLLGLAWIWVAVAGWCLMPHKGKERTKPSSKTTTILLNSEMPVAEPFTMTVATGNERKYCPYCHSSKHSLLNLFCYTQYRDKVG